MGPTPGLQKQSIQGWEQRTWTCGASLMEVQRSLTGSSVLFRGDEDSQREFSEEDTKLKLEDCSGVRYTTDPDPGVGGVFLNYMKNRLLGSRG